MRDVLNKTRKKWGVIVTGHSNYDSCISPSQFSRLKLEYENLITSKELDNIPYVSQALLPHVDAVVSVSSSLAFQSLLFDKPLILDGNIHINKVSTCDLNNIEKVFEFEYDKKKNFKILKFFFLKYQLLAFKIEDPVFFNKYLNRYYHNFKIKKDDVLLSNVYDTLDEYFNDLVKASQWRKWENLLQYKNIVKNPNPILLIYYSMILFLGIYLIRLWVDRLFIRMNYSKQ